MSVDWDYFFPSPAWYDWAHNESPLLMEMIWPMRVEARNMKTGEYAIDEMRPSPSLLHNFWERNLKNRPAKLILAESHSDMYSVVRCFPEGCDVVNFDQHHDIYYGEGLNREIGCDNWVAHGITDGFIKNYTLIYPPWADSDVASDRHNRPTDYDDRITVELEEPGPGDYDIVFVCRSSAWTPSWNDEDWLKFIGWWEGAYPNLWGTRNTIDSVERARRPSLEEARELRDDFEKMRQENIDRGVKERFDEWSNRQKE